MKPSSTILLLLLFCIAGAAELEWQAEFRYRLEQDKNILHADSIYTKRWNHYTRSRISLRFVEGPITGFAQLQDSRLLGEKDNFAGLTKSSGVKVEFHQIYFLVDYLMKRNRAITWRIGRFEMPLGAQRLFSKNNWNNFGRSFEGLQMVIANPFVFFNYFLLINTKNSDSAASDRYDQLIEGLYGSTQIKRFLFLTNIVFDLYGYNNTNQAQSAPSPEMNRTTFGTRWIFSLLFVNFDGELAHQSGKLNKDNALVHIDGSMNIFNMRVDLSRLPFVNKISVGKEYFSGDNKFTRETTEGFANPWGAGHKYHGYIDKITRFKDNFQNGVDEWNLKMDFTFPVKSENIMLNIHYHNFKDGFYANDIGTELDIIISSRMTPGGIWQQGYAIYWPETGEKVVYTYLMLNFTL